MWNKLATSLQGDLAIIFGWKKLRSGDEKKLGKIRQSTPSPINASLLPNRTEKSADLHAAFMR